MLLAAQPAFAQKQTGTIRGMVKDQAGEALPGVAVELKGPALMGSRTAATDEAGAFRFPALPVGAEYALTFSLQGFQTVTRTNQRVTIGGTVTLDIVLESVTLKTELTVTAASPLVDVEKSSFSSTYDAGLETIPSAGSPSSTGPVLAGHHDDRHGYSRASAFRGEEIGAYYVNGIDISRRDEAAQ
jgi:hypothetical protein